MSTPTSQDVAKRAGVSIATVSRVFNDSPHVRPDVKNRVQSAAQALNYQPNRTAQRLRARQSKVLGLIISDIENPFFTSVVRGIEDVAYHNGYSLVLCNSDEDPEKERLYVDVMRAESVAGVIITSSSEAEPQIGDLLDAHIPVIALDRRIGDPKVDSVLVSNAQGAYEAVAHLIALGHRCIGFIGLPLTRTTGRERFDGYQRALLENGLTVSGERVGISDAKQQGGYERALELLASQPCLTALFAANNLTTLGVLAAIRERGLKIPDDISIVGFDDMPWAPLLQPPLTAVAQPTYELGQKAAELLLGRLANPNKPVSDIQLDTTLIVRGSTAKPRE